MQFPPGAGSTKDRIVLNVFPIINRKVDVLPCFWGWIRFKDLTRWQFITRLTIHLSFANRPNTKNSAMMYTMYQSKYINAPIQQRFTCIKENPPQNAFFHPPKKNNNEKEKHEKKSTEECEDVTRVLQLGREKNGWEMAFSVSWRFCQCLVSKILGFEIHPYALQVWNDVFLLESKNRQIFGSRRHVFFSSPCVLWRICHIYNMIDSKDFMILFLLWRISWDPPTEGLDVFLAWFWDLQITSFEIVGFLR